MKRFISPYQDSELRMLERLAEMHELLRRCLKVVNQIPDLHELSYRMGQAGEGASPETMMADFRNGQSIITDAACLAEDLLGSLSSAIGQQQRRAKQRSIQEKAS
jgi:hypothetical protein